MTVCLFSLIGFFCPAVLSIYAVCRFLYIAFSMFVWHLVDAVKIRPRGDSPIFSGVLFLIKANDTERFIKRRLRASGSAIATVASMTDAQGCWGWRYSVLMKVFLCISIWCAYDNRYKLVSLRMLRYVFLLACVDFVLDSLLHPSVWSGFRRIWKARLYPSVSIQSIPVV